MTRPIKFRARIISEKRMVKVSQVQFADDVFTWILDSEGKVYFAKEVKLMQYTWRSDAGWQEIYEGYLVKYSWSSREDWEVYFDINKLEYRIKCQESEYGEYTHKSMTDLITKVVWNIYETK